MGRDVSRMRMEHSIISHPEDRHGMRLGGFYHGKPYPFEGLSPTADGRVWRDVHREAEAHGTDAAWALLRKLEAEAKLSKSESRERPRPS